MTDLEERRAAAFSSRVPRDAAAERPVKSSTSSSSRRVVVALLRRADIEIDGRRPWDIQIHDERFFQRVLRGGSMGLGETYVAGWWDCEQLDGFFERVLGASLHVPTGDMGFFLSWLVSKLSNPGRASRAFEIAHRHYDLGNDLFAAMLDPTMTYSCGYWKDAQDLASAQEAKLELVCRKIRIRPAMRILDIGCGWGSFAIHAARQHGARVVGITVSGEQQRLARDRGRGLPVEFRLEDYRQVDERFDAIVSIGMFEHVGPRNHATYFDVARRCLKSDGLFLLHTIGSAAARSRNEPWMARYIFPNSHIPSSGELAASLEGRFVVEDWHNFGADYDPTLLAWEANFRRNWPELRARYDGRFYRMWRYYLLSCAGSFRARYVQLWQLVLSEKGSRGGYRGDR